MTKTADDALGLQAVIGILKQQFGPNFSTSKSTREQHGHTTTWLENQPPDGVVFVSSETEIQDVVRICKTHKVPIIAFGTGSSLEGHVNAPQGGISLDTSKMNQILQVNIEDMDCRVQPGVTRKQLNEHLRATGLFFPVDPGANASLGGMAATRASGTNAVRYGTMKDQVLGLRAVLPSGEVVRTAQRARKTSAGYDLTHLMIGSEGTLGIITELTIRLRGIPEAISAATCSFASEEDACNAVIATVQMGIPVARIELLDALTVQAVNAYSKLSLPEKPLLLLEFHGSKSGVAEQAETFGEIAKDNNSTAFEWTVNAQERNRLWQARHDGYFATMALRPGAMGISTDTCVPVSRLAEAWTAAQKRAADDGFLAPIVGHVGDGNFHVLLLIDESQREKAAAYVSWLNEMAISMDGTCTGEHGIGQGKGKYLSREIGPEAVNLMATIKQAIDPDNLFNPGKIFQAV